MHCQSVLGLPELTVDSSLDFADGVTDFLIDLLSKLVGVVLDDFRYRFLNLLVGLLDQCVEMARQASLLIHKCLFDTFDLSAERFLQLFHHLGAIQLGDNL